MDSRDLHVTGGTDGTYAHLEDLHALAVSSDDLAKRRTRQTKCLPGSKQSSGE